MFPADPGRHRRAAGADGACGRAGRADARMARALRAPSIAPRSPRHPSVLHRLGARIRSRRARPSSAPRRWATRAPRHGSTHIGERCGIGQSKIAAAKNAVSAGDSWRDFAANPIKAASRCRVMKDRSCWSRACSIESGADVRYVGTACPQDPMGGCRPALARSAGGPGPIPRLAEQDLAAIEDVRAGSRHRHDTRRAKGQGARRSPHCISPTSSRRVRCWASRGQPHSPIVNAALGNRARFEEMRAFFERRRHGHTAGVWQETPEDQPQFSERNAAQLQRAAAKRKAEEMI